MPFDPVLVTGGAGFIGSHACKSLSKAGYLPVVVDNLSTGHRDNVKWGPLYELDVRNGDALGDVMARHGIKSAMHFAASAYVGESVQNPAKYYQNNIAGMQSLLDACVASRVEQLIFSSSCATYGAPPIGVISENCPQRPINPYGWTKLIGEQMLRDYAATGAFSYAILRYFNACGADPGGALAERHDPETHLIPLALQAAAGLRGRLNVFGTDYDTPDGSCVRDYIHVIDLARGHRLALDHLRAGGDPVTLNLGSGTGHSVLEIVAAIETVTGYSVPVHLAERRSGDPPQLTADPSRARQLLGFQAERSELAHIIGDAAPTFGLAQKRAAHA